MTHDWTDDWTDDLAAHIERQTGATPTTPPPPGPVPQRSPAARAAEARAGLKALEGHLAAEAGAAALTLLADWLDPDHRTPDKIQALSRLITATPGGWTLFSKIPTATRRELRDYVLSRL